MSEISDLKNAASNWEIAAHSWQARAEVAEADAARLREALTFYADENTWKVPKIGMTLAGDDKGRVARAALSDTAQDDRE